MTKENLKQALISILIAALAAFVSSLSQGLLDFIQSHAVDISAGAVSAAVYLAKAYKA